MAQRMTLRSKMIITLGPPMGKMLIFWDTLDREKRDCCTAIANMLNKILSCLRSLTLNQSQSQLYLHFLCLPSTGVDLYWLMQDFQWCGPIVGSSCTTPPDKRCRLPLDANVQRPLAVPWLGLLRALDDARRNFNHTGILRWEVLLIMQIQEKW